VSGVPLRDPGNVLEVEDLRTVFPTRRGDVVAVDGVSFEVARGETVGLVGETGSGKSVTLRSILGLVPAPGVITGGSIRFGGHDLVRTSARRYRSLRGRRLGLVAQQPWTALNPVFSIGDQFDTVLRTHRLGDRGQRRRTAEESLLSMGISDPERVLSGYLHELSGGMAQRVVMAISLSLDPELLLADEPTTALDITVQRQVLELLGEWARGDRRSLIIVTHDLGVVNHFCQKVVVMRNGRVVEAGPVDRVLRRPEHDYTSLLIRSSRELDGGAPDA